MVLQDTISYITNKSQLENMNGLLWASFIMMSFRVMLCILICQVSNLYKHIIYCKISFALQLLSQDNFLIIILRLFYDYRFDQELLLSFPFMHYHHLITEISHSCVIIVRREKLMKKRFRRHHLQLLLYEGYLIIIPRLFNASPFICFRTGNHKITRT